MLMTAKQLLLTSVLAAATTLAYATPIYTSTFQGATFTVTENSNTDFTFDISSSGLTGDWAGATSLGAFAFNDIGFNSGLGSAIISATETDPGNQSASQVYGGLSGGGGSACTGSGNFICFSFSQLAVKTNQLFDLTFDIKVTQGTFNFASTGPDLKIAWYDANGKHPDNTYGSLYSSAISPESSSVPEPSTFVLIGTCLIGMSFFSLSRKACG